jgi:hypothetical protein
MNENENIWKDDKPGMKFCTKCGIFIGTLRDHYNEFHKGEPIEELTDE